MDDGVGPISILVTFTRLSRSTDIRLYSEMQTMSQTEIFCLWPEYRLGLILSSQSTYLQLTCRCMSMECFINYNLNKKNKQESWFQMSLFSWNCSQSSVLHYVRVIARERIVYSCRPSYNMHKLVYHLQYIVTLWYDPEQNLQTAT